MQERRVHYLRRRRKAGGWLEGPSPERLFPAIDGEDKDLGFLLGGRKEAGADEVW